MDLFIVVNDFLTLLDLSTKQVHLGHLVTLNLPDHCLEIAIGTVLEQDRIDLPKRFSDMPSP